MSCTPEDTGRAKDKGKVMRNKYIKYKCAKCERQDMRLYRPYGEFYRPERVFCNAHVPQDEYGWYVPLIDDDAGTSIWGYASCPREDIERVRAMPEASSAGFESNAW